MMRNKKEVRIISKWTGLIIAFGIVIAILMIASAICEHINRANTIEFKSDYFSLRSDHSDLLE